MFICIKMDLTLNNLQRLICHKNKQTNTVQSGLPEDKKTKQSKNKNKLTN